MSDTIIKDLLASKIEDYKSGKLNFREFHPCSHITVRGVQCQNRCVMRPGDTKPKCHSHVKCRDVTQCSYINKDDNGEEHQCESFSRSKTGYCHYHSTVYKNKISARQYYAKNAEKIKKDKRDAYLLVRFDRLLTSIDDVINE